MGREVKRGTFGRRNSALAVGGIDAPVYNVMLH